MMMLALLAVAQPPQPPADDVVVIARKMRMIRVEMNARKRGGDLELYRCRVTRTSGDAEVDAVPCATARECMADRPATRRDLTRCVEERSQPRLDAIVAAHRAARIGRP